MPSLLDALNQTRYYLPNQTNIADMVAHVSQQTGYTLGIGILIGVFMMTFFSLKQFHGTENSLAASLWITAVISYLMAAISIIPASFILLPTILAFLSIFLLIKGD